jgi:hypothetical protein
MRASLRPPPKLPEHHFYSFQVAVRSADHLPRTSPFAARNPFSDIELVEPYVRTCLFRINT